MSSVLFVSNNFTRSYAGAYYAAEDLARRGWAVDLRAYAPSGAKREFPLLSHTPFDGWRGHIPNLRNR